MKLEEANKEELQLLWIVGTLERLCTLKYIVEVPYSVSPQSVDLYNSLKPYELFRNDAELCEVLSVLIKEGTPPEFQSQVPETIRGISALVLNYAKDPYHLVKKGLENLV